jgi:phage terminase Nu1 subunit (DNA packaging protein)
MAKKSRKNADKSTVASGTKTVSDETTGFLSTAELAAAAHCSPQYVRRLERRGIVFKVARDRWPVSAVEDIADYRAERAPGAEADKSLAHERTLLVKAQREKAELDLAVRRGEMQLRAENEAKAIEIVVATRNRLLAVPERAASRLGLNRHEVAAVDEEIRAALTELSQTGSAQQ